MRIPPSWKPDWLRSRLALASLRTDRLSIAILGFALVIVCGIWTAVELQIAQERATKIRDVMRENSNLSRAFEEHTVRTLAYIDEIAISIQRQYERQGSRFDLKAFYHDIKPNPALLRNVVITDPQGVIILSTDPFSPISLADREHVKVHYGADSGQLFISKPVLARVAKRWSIIATRRANNPDGTLAGVIGVAFDPAYFSNFYSDVDIGRQGVVTLVGTDGIVRARLKVDSDALGQDISDAPSFKRLVGPAAESKADYVSRSAVDKIERIYSSRKVTGYPLLVFVGTSMEESMVSANDRAGTYRQMSMAASVVIGALAWVLVLFNLRRVQSQKSLHEMGERLSATINASMDAIISVTEDERILVFNAAAEKLLGIAANQALGQPIDRFIPARYRTAHHGHVRSFLQTGTATRAVGEFTRLSAVTADGSEVPVEASISRVEVNHRFILTVTLRDVSERYRAQQALKATVKRYHNILSNHRSGVLVVSQDGHVEFVNAAFCNLFDLEILPEQLLGVSTVELIAMICDVFADPQAGVARIRAILALGLPVQSEEMAIRGDRTYLRDFTPLHMDGTPSGRLWYHYDVTESRRFEATRASLEMQVREAHKMQAIGTLAGGIAHDFNNIIATILGNADLAREDVSNNPLALQSLQEIQKAGSRARDLVWQILSFSRRQPTERKLVALAPILEESVRLLRATMPARLELDLQCDPATPAVLADASQIQQVLLNLATNAMQAMSGRSGRIEIRLEPVTLDAGLLKTWPVLRALHEQSGHSVVRMRVRDDGPGMDAVVQERIFEPFFTTKPKGEGTGLGLSVVLGIVQTHQGAITVESRVGQGSTFSLYLPLPAAQGMADPRSGTEVQTHGQVATASTPPLRILYLDDDEALVFLVRRLLQRRGCQVSGFVSAEDALAALHADPHGFDLVVSDYNMPGMSGLDFARAVRVIRAELPVAVATGFVDEQLRSEATDAGIRELIFKADTVDVFCDAMLRLASLQSAANR